MDEDAFRLVDTLSDVRERLGERAYREAVYLALHGIGVAVQREAERRAAPLGASKHPSKVVRFPLAKRRPKSKNT